MHLAGIVGIAEFRGAEMLGPAGIQRHAGIGGDIAVLGHPGLDVIGRQLCIGICIGLGADVDDDEGHHEIGDRDFGDRLAVFGKVERRIDMGACVFVDAQLKEIELVFLVVELLFAEELLLAEEGGRVLRQLVREVGDGRGVAAKAGATGALAASTAAAAPPAEALNRLRRESMRDFTDSMTQALHIGCPSPCFRLPADAGCKGSRPSVQKVAARHGQRQGQVLRDPVAPRITIR